MKLVLVSLDTLENYWEKVRPMIESACERSFGKYGPSDIMNQIMIGAMQLWIAEDDIIHSIAITENIQFPRIKVCKLICCAGKDKEKWIDLLADIETWAKEQGCKDMEAECRSGWSKALKHRGYESGHILMNKALA